MKEAFFKSLLNNALHFPLRRSIQNRGGRKYYHNNVIIHKKLYIDARPFKVLSYLQSTFKVPFIVLQTGVVKRILNDITDICGACLR